MSLPHRCSSFHEKFRGKVRQHRYRKLASRSSSQGKMPPKPPHPMVLVYSAAIWIHLTLDTPTTLGYTLAFSFMTYE